jgi:hypothetical protein
MMEDVPTAYFIADMLNRAALDRQQEADDARAGTGPFEGLADAPLPPGQLDLPTIAGVNDMLANAFAELASKIRKYSG